MTRRVFALLCVIIVTLLLAFWLQGAAYEMVMVPAAYVLWVLGLAYHSIHQWVLWLIVIAIVLRVLLGSLLSQEAPAKNSVVAKKEVAGQIETLSGWMKNSEHGTYFKWMIANRLGKIAYQILSRRDSGRVRSVFEPLRGVDWNPEKELESYLETGLQGSFVDFPRSNNPFARPVKTPLDYDVSNVIEFLEEQIKSQ